MQRERGRRLADWANKDIVMYHLGFLFKKSHDVNAIRVNIFVLPVMWVRSVSHDRINMSHWFCGVQKITIIILHSATTLYLYCCLVSHLPAFVSRSLVAKTLMMFRNNIKLT